MATLARASDVHSIAKLIPAGVLSTDDVYDLCGRINDVLQRAASGNAGDVISAAASAACKFFSGKSPAHTVAGCNVMMSIVQCVLQCTRVPSLDSREVKRATAALMEACAASSPLTAPICAVALRCWSQCDTHGCVNHPSMITDIGNLLLVCETPPAQADAASAAAALMHRAHVKAAKRGTAPSPQATLSHDIAALCDAIVSAATSKNVDMPPVPLSSGLVPSVPSSTFMEALLACTAVQQAHVAVAAGAYDVHLLSLLRCLSALHSALSDALAVSADSAATIAQAAAAVTKSVYTTVAHMKHSSVCLVISPQLLRVVVDGLRLAQAVLRAPSTCVPPPLAASVQAETAHLLQHTVQCIGPASCKYLSAASMNWLHSLLVAGGGSPLPGRLPLPAFPAQTKTGGRGSKRGRSTHIEVVSASGASAGAGEPVVDFGADYIRLDASGPGESSGAKAAAAASTAAAASSALYSVSSGIGSAHATPVQHAAWCVRACAAVWGARFQLPLSHPAAEAALKIAGASDAASRLLPHADVPLAYTAVGCHRSVRLAAEVVLALTAAAGATPAALLQQSQHLEEASVQARRMQLATPSADVLAEGGSAAAQGGGTAQSVGAVAGGLLGASSNTAMQTQAAQQTSGEAQADTKSSVIDSVPQTQSSQAPAAAPAAAPVTVSSLQAEASDSDDDDEVPDIV